MEQTPGLWVGQNCGNFSYIYTQKKARLHIIPCISLAHHFNIHLKWASYQAITQSYLLMSYADLVRRLWWIWWLVDAHQAHHYPTLLMSRPQIGVEIVMGLVISWCISSFGLYQCFVDDSNAMGCTERKICNRLLMCRRQHAGLNW